MSIVTYTVNHKSFVEAVEAIWLKGKYKSSTVSKTDVISNSAVAIYENGWLELLNGNDKSALSVKVEMASTDTKNNMFIFDIEKMMKYIKNMKTEQLLITINDAKISLVGQGGSKAVLPKLLEHTSMALITMIRAFNYVEDEPVIFGKTTMTCVIPVHGNALADAIKFCNLVGTATFKIDYVEGNEDFDGLETLTISSSNHHRTELVEKVMPTNGSGKGNATVEFSAPIDKFCINGDMNIITGDNMPIILTGLNRKMVIAPYIRVD